MPDRILPVVQPDQPSQADLDVLIPTRDRTDALAVTLTGLLAQDVTARLVLADQTPERSVAEVPEVATLLSVLRRRGWTVEVHHRTSPGRGIAEQRDFLVSRTRAGYALMLDDDVLMERWVLGRLLDAITTLDCGFVGMAHAAASFLDDRRPQEWAAFELLGADDVRPERVRKGTPGWQRWQLHNAANVAHLSERLPPEALNRSGWAAYKVAWVAGCVLFRTASLRAVGGFGFWADLPANLRGEDVVVQLRIAERDGGAGLLPSGAWHLELPTSLTDRSVDAYAALLDP